METNVGNYTIYPHGSVMGLQGNSLFSEGPLFAAFPTFKQKTAPHFIASKVLGAADGEATLKSNVLVKK